MRAIWKLAKTYEYVRRKETVIIEGLAPLVGDYLEELISCKTLHVAHYRQIPIQIFDKIQNPFDV